jgi:hypothetical protein
MSPLYITVGVAATLLILLTGRLLQAVLVLSTIDGQLTVEFLAELSPADRERHCEYMREAGFLLD